VRPLDTTVQVDDRSGMTLVSGDALVAGRAGVAGTEVHLGEVLEARGALRVEVPGKVWLLIEAGSRVRVEQARGTLVLALERGVVEADVNPVAEGEAFALDIAQEQDSVRVAVHGTHLRVARGAGHVTIDLSEGVVSVGAPPRSGMTLGSLLTAPAHAELSVADVTGTLMVSHDPGSLRPAVSLRPSSQPRPVAVSAPAAAARPEAFAAHPSSPALSVVRAEARPSAAAEPPVPPSTAPPALPPVDPNAEATLGTAVRACMPAQAGGANVTVQVTTTLHLDLLDDGMVNAARFDPPVATDVNTCATPSIYKTRFAHGGSASVRIDFTVPSSAP
jgi:hypothetical protein